jgi:hypothetical protein
VHVHVASRDQRYAGGLADLLEREQPQVVVHLVEQFDDDPEVAAEQGLGVRDVGR